MKDNPCRELITACCESSPPQSWMPRGEGTTHFHGYPWGQCHFTSFQPWHSGRQPGGETGKAGGSLGTCRGGAVTCITLGSPHSCPEGQGLTRGLRSRASSFFTSLGILQEFTCGFKPGSTISPVLRDDKRMGSCHRSCLPFLRGLGVACLGWESWACCACAVLTAWGCRCWQCCCQRAPTYNTSNQARPPSAKNVLKNSSVMT